ncbi:hypothetical protein OU798_08785 [Prolixibacteraceae bacterium Z1-6]|uniref:Uncharacterized protein n=1 Tax=Draconibacterium aestuarii TaxID=2998507 RepID=A0A9X3J5I7_9BACT|nr:hypothetical protein [Prolixibacteraceae bacterium Z1-6]
MAKVRLELESIEILAKRSKWNLYFICYTNHPEDPSKSLMRLLPKTGTIQLTKKSDNPYSFKPKGEGSDGLKVYQNELNQDKEVVIRLCMMQSRKRLRNTAEVLADVKEQLTIKGLKDILTLSRLQWFVVDAGIDVLTKSLSKIKDRELGFISMDEEFGEEFKKNPNQKRTKKISSGKAKLTWIWDLKD